MVTRRTGRRTPDPTCRCRDALLVIATWRQETLVSVIRRHWPSHGCPMPPESVDPIAYATGRAA